MLSNDAHIVLGQVSLIADVEDLENPSLLKVSHVAVNPKYLDLR